MSPLGKDSSANAALPVNAIRRGRLAIPRLLGPSSRNEEPATICASSARRRLPSASVGRNPSAITVATGTPSSAHSRTASTAASAPVRIRTWSGMVGRALRLGQARSPSTVSRVGFTG
jgi:hypothetical protein